MSQTMEEQVASPTPEEVIGKVNESISALQDAQKTVVEGAQLLARHVNDPNAHGAAIPEVVEQHIPVPVMEGTMLQWQKPDGTPFGNAVDLKGEPGRDGVDGQNGKNGQDGQPGPRLDHRWEGTKLLIQNVDGSWPDEGVDLKGDKGDTGQVEGLSDAVDSDSSTTPASSKAVKTAYDKAVSAQNAANAADSKAQAAQSAADTAQAAAEAADAKAQTAQSTAQNAEAKAQEGLTSAEAADSKAQAAQSAADTAQAAAEAADAKAQSAQSAAQNAQTTADSAMKVFSGTTLAPLAEKFQALGNVSGTKAVNLTEGLAISATITGATTFSFTDVPQTGATVVVMQLTNGGSQTITWPSSIKWAGGTAPKFTASGIDIVVLTTNDAGATWYGIVNLKYA